MAIQKADLTAVTGDTVFTGFDKYNNTCDEIFVSGQSSNGLITFTKFGGGTTSVNIALTKNEVISGGILTINPLDFLEVEISEVTYNLDGASYSIAVPSTVTLSAGDPTNPRIDLIYADNLFAIAVTTGTPSANPVAPSIGVNQTVIGYVYVDANATSLGGTALPLFQQNSSGTPNNTTYFDSNGNLTETDVITTNGSSVTFKSGTTFNINNVTFSGADIIFTGDNINLTSTIEAYIKTTFLGNNNIVLTDANNISILGQLGNGDITISAIGTTIIDANLLDIDSATDLTVDVVDNIAVNSDSMSITATTTLDLNADTILNVATTEIQLDAPQTTINGKLILGTVNTNYMVLDSTTNATPKVIESIPISTNTVKRIQVDLLAYNSTTFTSYEVSKYFGCGFRAGGNVAVSALSSTIIENFAPNIALTFVANTTTQEIDITATGIAGTNISWKLKISIF